MKFCELINAYIEKLSCSAKELADASELSSVVISRYRTGEREPNLDGEQLQKLVSGIVRLASAKGVSDITSEQVFAELQNSLNRKNAEYEKFVANYDTLIHLLEINMKTLSSVTNFDSSYLYRVRSGQRRPNDLDEFCNSFCRFVVTHHSGSADKAKVAALLGCTVDAICRDTDYASCLQKWLYQGTSEKTSDSMENFLNKLDEFNLDEYIRAIRFDELKVPTVPFRLPVSKTYYGIEEMRKGELDFFKATVLSKSQEPIFMCSDMPMEDMAKDMEFNKKWMFAIAMSLKKGLHLNIIHNIDRPFHEMMLGLESWIPIYMTGQVSPYHLPNVSTKVYHHFNYVSGTVALTGECINGHHKNGKYYLTNNREEVAYYKQKAADLLSKAQPLMEIFRTATESLFQAFLVSDAQESGKRHNMLSSPPIYTISPELLQGILNRTSLSEEDKNKIRKFVKQQRELMETILSENPVFDEITAVSPAEFEQHPVNLSVAGAFYETDIPYTYEEYKTHIRLTKEFAENHPNYTLNASSAQTFRNIQIQILEGKYVMISKVKTPVIHFVIRHPKMIDAIGNFIAPVVE
ncbi:MAG: hypothetical protein ACI4QX_09160 [Lachnospiraceae bacterium]